MKRHCCVLGLLVSFGCPAAAQVANDPQPAVTAGSEVVATSRYIWRGFEDGGFSLQPNTWIEFGGWRATSWFNLAAKPTERSAFTEQDVRVQYARRFGSYEIAGGWTGYFFPCGYRHSHATFVTIEREGPLTPSIAVYHDFRLGNGTYVNAAIAHPWPAIIPAIELASTFGVGYNRHQWTDETGFSDANIGLRGTWRGNGRISLSPFIKYSRSLNRLMVPTRTYGGIELAVR
jgi:hypothetical protein